VPHYPDNITYQNHCHSCDFQYFKSNITTPTASAFHTPTTRLLMVPEACLAKPSSIGEIARDFNSSVHYRQLCVLLVMFMHHL
jgi:hypothetical protein